MGFALLLLLGCVLYVPIFAVSEYYKIQDLKRRAHALEYASICDDPETTSKEKSDLLEGLS